MQTIPLVELSIVFIPTVFLLFVMFRWQLKAWVGLYANIRIILQLLLVGYFLTFIFETNQPIVIVLLIAAMIGVSTWIALRSFEEFKTKSYLNSFDFNWSAWANSVVGCDTNCVEDAAMV
jgi:putative ABC transport system permease protein